MFLVRKLGVPGHPELAMGAIAEGGIEVLSPDLIRDLGIPRALVEQVAVRERLELERRDTLYRGSRRPAIVRDRTVILVDDGLATGSTMEAAILALKQQHPARLVVAVPVGARETCERLRRMADELVCVATPEPFNEQDRNRNQGTRRNSTYCCDYITPGLVSSTQFIGNVVYSNVGVANNLPLAAAFATVPVVVMVLYLLGARRLGAFEQL